METLECIKSRTSTRSYKPDKIPEEDVEEIIDAAIHAPSAGNLQDWEFVLVKDPENKRGLMRACADQAFVGQSQVSVVVCSNLESIGPCGERGRRLYTIQDTAAATQNLMLGAGRHGIGTCWIGKFEEEEVRELLGLPEHVRPVAVIPLGYPSQEPGSANRRPLEESLHEERF